MNNNPNNAAMQDEEPLIIRFQDDKGNDIYLEFLDMIIHDGNKYAVLLPVDDSDEAGEVLLFRVEETDSGVEDIYYAIEDENLEIELFEIFKEKFKDEFNFVD